MKNETPARVIFFSNHLRGPLGAAGARSWHQARALSTEFDVVVIIPAIDPVTSQAVTEETYSGLGANVSVIKSWTTSNFRSSKIARAVFFLSAMFSQFVQGLRVGKCDLVLTMSLPVTLLFVATLISKIRSVPLIVDVRDLPFETAGEIGYISNRIFINMLKSVESFCLRKARFVLTNSPRYEPYLIGKGVKAERLSIAPIGYDDFPPPDRESVNKWRNTMLEYFESPPGILAIYSGTIGYAFPVEWILEAAELLKNNENIGFVIYGDGQRKNEFEDFCADRKLNVRFPGRVPKIDIHAICRAADICLYPAQRGEFSAAILGNKVFDYLGAGKPIVYTGPDSAVADVIVELGAGIICPPDDKTGFAEAIRRLAESPDLIARYASSANGFRDAGYTAQSSAMKLARLVQKALRDTCDKADGSP